jgi:hypothetical protein
MRAFCARGPDSLHSAVDRSAFEELHEDTFHQARDREVVPLREGIADNQTKREEPRSARRGRPRGLRGTSVMRDYFAPGA